MGSSQADASYWVSQPLPSFSPSSKLPNGQCAGTLSALLDCGLHLQYSDLRIVIFQRKDDDDKEIINIREDRPLRPPSWPRQQRSNSTTLGCLTFMLEMAHSRLGQIRRPDDAYWLRVANSDPPNAAQSQIYILFDRTYDLSSGTLTCAHLKLQSMRTFFPVGNVDSWQGRGWPVLALRHFTYRLLPISSPTLGPTDKLSDCILARIVELSLDFRYGSSGPGPRHLVVARLRKRLVLNYALVRKSWMFLLRYLYSSFTKRYPITNPEGLATALDRQPAMSVYLTRIFQADINHSPMYREAYSRIIKHAQSVKELSLRLENCHHLHKQLTELTEVERLIVPGEAKQKTSETRTAESASLWRILSSKNWSKLVYLDVQVSLRNGPVPDTFFDDCEPSGAASFSLRYLRLRDGPFTFKHLHFLLSSSTRSLETLILTHISGVSKTELYDILSLVGTSLVTLEVHDSSRRTANSPDDEQDDSIESPVDKSIAVMPKLKHLLIDANLITLRTLTRKVACQPKVGQHEKGPCCTIVIYRTSDSQFREVQELFDALEATAWRCVRLHSQIELNDRTIQVLMNVSWGTVPGSLRLPPRLRVSQKSDPLWTTFTFSL